VAQATGTTLPVNSAWGYNAAMKITHLQSATELIEANGVRILTDPWLVDGEYYGSWFHVPSYEGPVEELEADWIYVSHIHPDHFSRKTFARLSRKIPVLIHRYASPFLKRNIEMLGFLVAELPHGEAFALGNGVEITIFAADNCNPELCSRFFGCAPVETRYGSTQIDTMAVVSDGRHTILNTNDCPFALAGETLAAIAAKFGTIDLLLVGYAGAGPYPQCFHFDDLAKQREAAARKEAQFLDIAGKYVEAVKPRAFMPFAGTYVLGGRLAHLNDLRGVPSVERAFDLLKAMPQVAATGSEAILINPGEHYDLAAGKASAPYRRQGGQAAGLAHIATRPYDYDSEPVPTRDEVLALAPAAYDRFEAKRREIDFRTQTRILIDIPQGEVIEILPGQGWSVRPRAEAMARDGYVAIGCDPRLLHQLLKGPRFAHWNNAEIGSHLTFRREPDRFERGLYFCLCSFHA